MSEKTFMRGFFCWTLIIILFVLAISVVCWVNQVERMAELSIVNERLMEERRIIWTQVNDAPNVIYFVSCDDDTVWYTKLKKAR